jgi:hypothetical protein
MEAGRPAFVHVVLDVPDGDSRKVFHLKVPREGAIELAEQLRSAAEVESP